MTLWPSGPKRALLIVVRRKVTWRNGGCGAALWRTTNNQPAKPARPAAAAASSHAREYRRGAAFAGARGGATGASFASSFSPSRDGWLSLTGATNRYPLRASVSTYRGLSAESPRASRRRFTAV